MEDYLFKNVTTGTRFKLINKKVHRSTPDGCWEEVLAHRYSASESVESITKSYNMELHKNYPQDTEYFNSEGYAMKELNGRKLIWNVDDQIWELYNE